jgi:hypothetical protein
MSKKLGVRVIYRKIRYMKYVTFYLQVTQYIHNTRFHFDTCLIFTFHPVTVHNTGSRNPPPASLLAGTRLTIDCRALSNVPEGGYWLDRHKNMLDFFYGAECAGDF